MIITSIKEQKNNSKCSIFIDGAFAFSMLKSDILYFKLKENTEISQEKYNFIMDTIIYIKAQDIALNYIGYKMRTENEVYKKLKEKEFNDDIIFRVIEFAKKYNYINDLHYCESYIKESIKLKPKGKNLLLWELKRKGVDDKFINLALNNIELNEFEGALKLISKKFKNIENIDFKQKKKIFDFLAQKGYSYDIIKEAFDEFLNTKL